MRRTRLGCPGAYLSGPCCAAAGSRHGCSKQRHDCERGSRSRPPDAARWCERPLAPTAGAAGAVLRTPGRSVSALGRDKSTPSPTSSTARQPNSAAWLLRYKAQSRPSSPSLQAGGDKPAARSSRASAPIQEVGSWSTFVSDSEYSGPLRTYSPWNKQIRFVAARIFGTQKRANAFARSTTCKCITRDFARQRAQESHLTG